MSIEAAHTCSRGAPDGLWAACTGSARSVRAPSVRRQRAHVHCALHAQCVHRACTAHAPCTVNLQCVRSARAVCAAVCAAVLGRLRTLGDTTASMGGSAAASASISAVRMAGGAGRQAPGLPRRDAYRLPTASVTTTSSSLPAAVLTLPGKASTLPSLPCRGVAGVIHPPTCGWMQDGVAASGSAAAQTAGAPNVQGGTTSSSSP